MTFKLDKKRISGDWMKKNKKNRNSQRHKLELSNHWTGFHIAALGGIEEFLALCCNPVSH